MNNIKKSIIALTLLICLLLIFSTNILILSINIIPYSITESKAPDINKRYSTAEDYDTTEDDIPVVSGPTDSVGDIGMAPRPEITEQDKMIVNLIGGIILLFIMIIMYTLIFLIFFTLALIIIILAVNLIKKKKTNN